MTERCGRTDPPPDPRTMSNGRVLIVDDQEEIHVGPAWPKSGGRAAIIGPSNGQSYLLRMHSLHGSSTEDTPAPCCR